ncbi:NmrA family protein [Colletotrichum navitas]|uniref:NmrA family protein n=1 Tax=Colletotrichum navitas TaxID=681940 RepID=A0AAD8V4C9_9PEZI|nr:NmrA family protein [Colletotrichum navitas]KAK1590267.1 NmrA family protein [Colletotrichum navitas]
MIAVIGAAGKVGFATTLALRQANVPVRAILRDHSKAARLRALGCEIAIADLHDADALGNAIAGAGTVQARDGAQDVVLALEKAQPKRVLAISDYGAHVGFDIGMPTMCGTLKTRISQLQGHKVILRSAEHMQNWNRAIPAAIVSGTLTSFPILTSSLLPTVSAPDVGKVAPEIIRQAIRDDELQIIHVEGPQRYSVQDVAAALSELLGREIGVEVAPREQWKEALQGGMSASLAELLPKANDALNQGGLIDIEPNGEVVYGTTELVAGLRLLLPTQLDVAQHDA